ncbi:MAG: ATP-binding protein, partial [Natronosporangium sp.]
MTTPVDLSQPIVRDEVLAQLRQVLAARHRLVLCGPAGVGKSVLLDQLLSGDPSGPVLRAFPVGSPPRYAVLAELFSTLDAALLESLPGPRRQALAALLRWDRAAAGDPDPVALQLALRDLLGRLGRLATAGPVWLVVDSAERADEASLDTLAQLFKHLPPAAVRAVVASRQPGLSHRLGLPGDQEVGVPAWTMGEVAELLAPLRLAGKAVVRVHRASGGLPDLALRIGLTLPASPASPAGS